MGEREESEMSGVTIVRQMMIAWIRQAVRIALISLCSLGILTGAGMCQSASELAGGP